MIPQFTLRVESSTAASRAIHEDLSRNEFSHSILQRGASRLELAGSWRLEYGVGVHIRMGL